jgi:4-hydroxy-tetrahydrodipicolinate synthase
MELKGIFVPHVTPFDEQGSIDKESLTPLIEFWLGAGVSGVVVNSSTGEGPFISVEEKRGLLKLVRERVDGRGLVIAGTGAMSTRETLKLTSEANDLGADAALVTTPFFFKPTEEELFQHFVSLTESVDLPVILYNVPKFTGYTVSPQIVDRISRECSNVVGIKDSSGNLGAMAENLRLFGDRINVLSGAADMTLPALVMGGKGAILAVANAVPHTCVELHKAVVNEELREAGRLQILLSYVNKVLIREHPQVAAVKTAMSLKKLNAGIPRRPLKPLTREQVSEVREALNALNII